VRYANRAKFMRGKFCESLATFSLSPLHGQHRVQCTLVLQHAFLVRQTQVIRDQAEVDAGLAAMSKGWVGSVIQQE